MGRGLREPVQGAHSPDLEMDRLISEAAVVIAQGRSGQKMRRCPQGQVRGPSRGVGVLHKLGRALLLSQSPGMVAASPQGFAAQCYYWPPG